MLPGSGLGNQPLFTHAQRQEALPQAVVDLVRPGMQQVLTLQVNARAAQLFREPARIEERRRTSCELLQKLRQQRLEAFIMANRVVCPLQLLDGMHQRFRNVTPAEFAEATSRVRPGG